MKGQGCIVCVCSVPFASMLFLKDEYILNFYRVSVIMRFM